MRAILNDIEKKSKVFLFVSATQEPKLCVWKRLVRVSHFLLGTLTFEAVIGWKPHAELITVSNLLLIVEYSYILAFSSYFGHGTLEDLQTVDNDIFWRV